ncbi:MAG: hypothetical protein LBJ00_02365 [Planctomycetaceae bacterium]|nr:hypothetical protein [Planctomycetaceae bacterium]
MVSSYRSNYQYTVAGKAIGFAPEQPLHVVALACSASGILKQLEYNNLRYLRADLFTLTESNPEICLNLNFQISLFCIVLLRLRP